MLVVVAIGTRLCWLGFIRDDIEVGVYDSHDGTKNFQQSFPDRYFTVRICCLGGRYYYLRFLRGLIREVDAFKRLVYRDGCIRKTDVRPLQGAYLADTHTCVETYQYAEVAECEVFGKVFHQFSLVVECQHRESSA